MVNEYLPAWSEILDIKKHTASEYTFRMAYEGDVRPGQFFEVSIPKFGEAPISVSGIGDGWVEMTIRRVGRVTGEIFERAPGSGLFLRGPYGNGFDVSLYEGRELVIIAGGTGLSPVRGVIEHLAAKPEARCVTLISGFKSTADIIFGEDIDRWRGKINVVLTVDKMEPGDEVPGCPCKVGLVTEHIGSLDLRDIDSARAIVVGPPIMMKFATKGLRDFGFKEENVWISHERRMCCGIGKCGHCKIDSTYVCIDGPVFNLADARSLRD